MITPQNQYHTRFIRRIKPAILIAYIKKKVKHKKPSAWNCACGYTIPKKSANISGGPQYNQDYHIRCPNCGRIVAPVHQPQRNPVARRNGRSKHALQ